MKKTVRRALPQSSIAAVRVRRCLLWSLGTIVALSLFIGHARASITASNALRFEATGDWFLAEGSGQLQAATVHTEGQASLQIGGSYWRRLSSVALAAEGEPSSTVAFDVRLEAPAESWETVGVVLRAPSVGVWWSDLGQISLGGTAIGSFDRKSFVVTEQVREAIRTASDLTILISLNTVGTVQLDNGTFFSVPVPPVDPPDPIPNPTAPSTSPSPCTVHDIHVVDIDADFGDIWAGRELPETGKRTEPNAKATLTFDAEIDPSLVIGSFVPQDSQCGTPIAARGSNWSGAWNAVVPSLGGQAFPGDFNVVALEGLQGVPDAGGPIAAGGNVTLQGFSLNHGTQEAYGLVSGGIVTLNGGSILGNVRYAVPSSIPPTVSITGNASLGALVDFQGAFENLNRLSRGLNNLAPTADASLEWSTLTLLGSEPRLNVFEVEADILAQARSIVINVPASAGVVVNIQGSSPRIENVGIALDGAGRSTLLWNAGQARTVTLSGVSLPGAILAPRAAVQFTNGNVQGSLVARSLSGGGSFQHYPLDVMAIVGAAERAGNVVELHAASPLGRGCAYRFVLPQSNSLTLDGRCLAEPVSATFTVAERGSPSGREIQPRAADKRLGTLRRFEIVDGINTPIGKAFARYAPRLGVSEGDLVATSAEIASPGLANGTSTFYQQHFRDVPVYGYGYFAHSLDGNLRAAIGKVMPGLGIDVEPLVDETAALNAVRTALNLATVPIDDATGMPLEGLLQIHADGGDPSPADFRLTWRFLLSPSAMTTATIARVDATDGHVIVSSPSLLPALDPAGIYVGQVNQSFNTLFDGVRTASVAAFQVASDQEFGLSSGPLGASATTGVVVYTGLPTLQDPSPANWPFEWAGGNDPSWSSSLLRNLASIYWASQEARAYGDSLDLQFNGGSWFGLDGTGETPVRIWYDTTTRLLENSLPPNAFFYTRDSLSVSTIVIVPSATTVPANLEVLAHEQFHGMIYNARERQGLDRLGPYREVGALDEGLADAFAVAAVHAMNPDDLDWSCMDIGASCVRNLADPKSMQLPARYLGAHYTDYSTSSDQFCENLSENRCGTHDNSTVVGHWAYLLSQGSGGPVPDSCNVTVDPLDGTLDQALGDVVNIAFQAAATQLVPEATFADLRDSTIFVAEAHLGHEAGRKVETAWYAVGVGDQPALFSVAPADGAVDVEPWRTTFSWVSETNGPWVLVLAEDPSFGTELGSFPVAAIPHADGTYRASLTVTLTPGKRYHWRVKKEGADILCWLMNSSFETAQKQIELVSPAMPLNGYYQTGFLGEVDWQLTGGNRDYLVRLSDDRVADACASGTTEWGESELALGDSFDTLHERRGMEILGGDLDPDHTYYLYIQPTFDSDLAPGEQERGVCAEFKVRKERLGSFQAIAPMRGPTSQMNLRYYEVTDTPQGTALSLSRQTPFEFSPSEGAVAYQLVVTATAGPDTVVYDETREPGHCALEETNAQGEVDGHLHWLLNCDGPAQLDGEPLVEQLVHPGDLFWHVYAIGPDGGTRKAWHVGDEQPTPGSSSEEAYFNFVYDFLPPLSGEASLVLAGFGARDTGEVQFKPYRSPPDKFSVRQSVEFAGVQVERYTSEFHFPADDTTIQRFILNEQPYVVPMMTGMRYWYSRDDEPLQGPFILDFRDDPPLAVDDNPFTLGTPGTLLNLIYQPLELDYGLPGEHRVIAKHPTQIISEVYADAPSMPEPEPEPDPPACMTPSKPRVDPLFAADETDLLSAPGQACRNFFPMTIFGFAFGWDPTPGAVKYHVNVESLFGDLLMSADVDDNSFRGLPPVAYLPGCGYSGYIFSVTAINPCGEASETAFGGIGYSGPYADF